MTEEQHQTPSDHALKEIEARLNALRQTTTEAMARSSGGAHPIGRLMWLAFNVVSDLLAGVLCGLGIGYGIDYWLGTRPVFIAVFLVLGCIAGVLNVVCFLQQHEKKQQEKGLPSEEKE